MYTDYINGEERARVIGRKLIWWVAAITCTGGAVDATGALDVVRARAMTAPFMARHAPATPKFERVPMLAGDIAAIPAEETVVTAVPAPPPAPVRTMPPPMQFANAHADFEAALTKLALTSVAEPKPDAPASPPANTNSYEEAIPTVPFEREGLSRPASAQPAPAASTETAKPVETITAIVLPVLADVPLPRSKPPLTPAQELGLEGKERAKAEQCLAKAVYFEARNEPVRGQIAVAQVVLNRVFSPYYPDTVCGVVFQNAHRFLSCQFTFACDGKSKAIRERSAWARAQRIAKQTLDSKVWLPEVAKSTHYHATYVRPNWIREMRKMVRHGQHIFYRPHRWGDGADEAGWGVASLQAPQKAKFVKRN